MRTLWGALGYAHSGGFDSRPVHMTNWKEKYEELEAEVRELLKTIPRAVMVHEGGGPLNLGASLAVSVAKLQHEKEKADNDLYTQRNAVIALQKKVEAAEGPSWDKHHAAVEKAVRETREACALKILEAAPDPEGNRSVFVHWVVSIVRQTVDIKTIISVNSLGPR